MLKKTKNTIKIILIKHPNKSIIIIFLLEEIEEKLFIYQRVKFCSQSLYLDKE